jgi:hypothetical protein
MSEVFPMNFLKNAFHLARLLFCVDSRKFAAIVKFVDGLDADDLDVLTSVSISGTNDSINELETRVDRLDG